MYAHQFQEIVLQVPATKMRDLFVKKAEQMELDANEAERTVPNDHTDMMSPPPLYIEGMIRSVRNEAASWRLAAMCLPSDGTIPITLGSLLAIASDHHSLPMTAMPTIAQTMRPLPPRPFSS